MNFNDNEIRLLIEGLNYYLGYIESCGLYNNKEYIEWELKKKRPNKKLLSELEEQNKKYLEETNNINNLINALKEMKSSHH